MSESGLMHDLRKHLLRGGGFWYAQDVVRHLGGKENVYGTYYQKIENTYFAEGKDAALDVALEAADYAKNKGDILQYLGFRYEACLVADDGKSAADTAVQAMAYVNKTGKTIPDWYLSNMESICGWCLGAYKKYNNVTYVSNMFLSARIWVMESPKDERAHFFLITSIGLLEFEGKDNMKRLLPVALKAAKENIDSIQGVIDLAEEMVEKGRGWLDAGLDLMDSVSKTDISSSNRREQGSIISDNTASKDKSEVRSEQHRNVEEADKNLDGRVKRGTVYKEQENTRRIQKKNGKTELVRVVKFFIVAFLIYLGHGQVTWMIHQSKSEEIQRIFHETIERLQGSDEISDIQYASYDIGNDGRDELIVIEKYIESGSASWHIMIDTYNFNSKQLNNEYHSSMPENGEFKVYKLSRHRLAVVSEQYDSVCIVYGKNRIMYKTYSCEDKEYKRIQKQLKEELLFTIATTSPDKTALRDIINP